VEAVRFRAPLVADNQRYPYPRTGAYHHIKPLVKRPESTELSVVHGLHVIVTSGVYYRVESWWGIGRYLVGISWLPLNYAQTAALRVRAF